MNLFKYIMVLFLAMVLAGCTAYVIVDKRPNIALPVYFENNTNAIRDYVVLDQGYRVKYSKTGFNTEIQDMTAELTTNKTVKFSLYGLNSIVPTNGISIKADDLLKIVQLFRNATNDVIVIDRNAIKQLDSK